MNDVWITSDTHFGHSNFLTFVDDKGELIRRFSSVEEMDQTMIDNWNRVVGKNDKLYHLGDLCFSLSALDRIMPQLNGTKVLILGNHCKFKKHQYLKYFKDIRSTHRLDDFILTHIPIHPDCIGRKLIANIHGHLHKNTIKLANGFDDLRYFNVCVELHNYTPVDFEYIRNYFIINFKEKLCKNHY